MNNADPILLLPALRGVMGDWVYYSCLMNLEELSSRVSFAKEIHKNSALSDMIQRELKGRRSAQIAEYLQTQGERFFNSLVVATYGGRPDWFPVSSIRNTREDDDLRDLSEENIASIGFLRLSGDERLFALDGQHRLAGIKKAIGEGLNEDHYDEVSVILVAHSTTTDGLERTRRLFTTLNKTARLVSKGDIVALDEDDVMAICVRRLIEDTNLFPGKRIAYVASNNVPVNNRECLTTIGNLYDILGILFTSFAAPYRRRLADLRRVRPPDNELNDYFSLANSYFAQLASCFEELGKFFDSTDSGPIARRFRGNHGGSAVFRPIGLEIFTRIIAKLTRTMALQDAVTVVAKLPRDLNHPPYETLMWDTSNKTISTAHKVTLREVLLYMIGASGLPQGELLARYRKEMGKSNIALPKPIV